MRSKSLDRRILAGIVLFLGLVSELAGSARTAELDRSRLHALRPAMQKFVDQKMVAGAVVLVGRSNEIALVEAVGQLDLETGRPMQRDSIFRIMSMTKPITAVGIMVLGDEGKLKIDDPVEKHLPEFRGQLLVAGRADGATTLKRPARPITIRDLLTHTSGLPSMPPAGIKELYAERQHSLKEAVLVYSQQPLEFEPGSRWSYCNAGIDTLGRIIEVASGQSYESFLRDRLFVPLGMRDTTFYPTAEQNERVAGHYELKEGKLTAVTRPIIGSPAGAKFAVPAGGLYSTADDQAKFYQMMLRRGQAGQHRFLRAESCELMCKDQIGALQAGFAPGMCFGLGWGVVRQPQGVTEMLSAGTFGHGGAYGTQGWIDPHKDLFIVILIQRTGLPNADASEIRHRLQRIAFDALVKRSD